MPELNEPARAAGVPEAELGRDSSRPLTIQALSLVPPALLVILCLLFFHTALVGPYVFPWDFTEIMYPFQRFVDSSIRAGEFPLWDPYVMSGYPIIGDP